MSLRIKLSHIYHHHKTAFLTFLATGIGTTVIYIGLFTLLWYGFHIHPILAVSIAFIIAAAFQFFANRKITFKVKGHKLFQQIFKYITLVIINYVITISIIQFTLLLFPSPLPGLVIASGATVITGYFLFKYWVFNNTFSIYFGDNNN